MTVLIEEACATYEEPALGAGWAHGNVYKHGEDCEADIRQDDEDEAACHDDNGEGDEGEGEIQPEVPGRWHRATVDAPRGEEDASEAQIAARNRRDGSAGGSDGDAASCEDRPDGEADDGAGGEEDIRA